MAAAAGAARRAGQEPALVADALQVPEHDPARALPEGRTARRAERLAQAELGADHIGVVEIPPGVAHRAPGAVAPDLDTAGGWAAAVHQANVAVAGDRTERRFGAVGRRRERVVAVREQATEVVAGSRLAMQRPGRGAVVACGHSHRPGKLERHAGQASRVVGRIRADGDGTRRRGRQVDAGPLGDAGHVGVWRRAFCVHDSQARERRVGGVVAPRDGEAQRPSPVVAGSAGRFVECQRQGVVAVRQRAAAGVAGRGLAEQREGPVAVVQEVARNRSRQRHTHAAGPAPDEVDAQLHPLRGGGEVHRRPVHQSGDVGFGRRAAVDQRDRLESRRVGVRHHHVRDGQGLAGLPGEVRFGVGRRRDRIGARHQRALPGERHPVGCVRDVRGSRQVEAHAANGRAPRVGANAEARPRRKRHQHRRAVGERRERHAVGVDEGQPGHGDLGLARPADHRERHRPRQQGGARRVRAGERCRRDRVVARDQGAAPGRAVQPVGRGVAHPRHRNWSGEIHPHADRRGPVGEFGADVERARTRRIEVDDRIRHQIHRLAAVGRVDEDEAAHGDPRGRVRDSEGGPRQGRAGGAGPVRFRIRRRGHRVGSRRQFGRPGERRTVGHALPLLRP